MLRTGDLLTWRDGGVPYLPLLSNVKARPSSPGREVEYERCEEGG
jgi:hypothetical protein